MVDVVAKRHHIIMLLPTHHFDPSFIISDKVSIVSTDAIFAPGYEEETPSEIYILFVYLDVLEIPVLLHLDLVLTDVVVVES